MNTIEKPKVLIIGAGFGGIWAAEKFTKHTQLDITILDKNNYHTFLPLLYQVAAAELEAERIAQPVRTLFRDHDNIRFRLGEVTAIDFEQQQVITSSQTFDYDYLLLAMGSTNHYFGIPGAEEHSFTLKSIEEGIVLRSHILQLVETAARTTDLEKRRQLLTFVVVGGGPTGVEYAGALAELLHHPVNKDFPELNLREEANIVLVEMLAELLPGIGGGDYAYKRLTDKGIDVRLETAVERIEADAVHFKNGEMIYTDTPIWTAGVKGVTLEKEIPLERVKGGRIPVRDTLQSNPYDNVFIIGDLAYFEQDDEMLPGVAQVAMQQGEHAAENIVKLAAGHPPTNFRYNDKGSMATIGRNAAVANFGGRVYTGFFAWLLWLVVHIFFLIGFRNRIGVLFNWAWNYIFYDRAVRLILPVHTEKEKKKAPIP